MPSLGKGGGGRREGEGGRERREGGEGKGEGEGVGGRGLRLKRSYIYSLQLCFYIVISVHCLTGGWAAMVQLYMHIYTCTRARNDGRL